MQRVLAVKSHFRGFLMNDNGRAGEHHAIGEVIRAAGGTEEEAGRRRLSPLDQFFLGSFVRSEFR